MIETHVADAGRQRPAVPQWRRLDERFWVGSVDGRPLGTVERGRCFTWVDRDGETHRGYRSLADAQLAALAEAPAPQQPAAARRALLVTAALLPLATVVFALGCVAGTMLP